MADLYDHPSGDKEVGGEGKPTDDNCDDFDGDDAGVALARRWRCTMQKNCDGCDDGDGEEAPSLKTTIAVDSQKMAGGDGR